MKAITKKIKVDKKWAKEIQKHIDDNKPLEERVDDNGLLEKSFTAKFNDSIEVDINIYDSRNGPWIDAILFFNGQERVTLEPQYVLLGEGYPFEYKGVKYVVKLEAK